MLQFIWPVTSDAVFREEDGKRELKKGGKKKLEMRKKCSRGRVC